MESYIIFFIVMAGLLLLLALMGMVRERKQLAEFRSKVRESFGHLPDSGPDPERYAHIAGYYRKHRTPACIDDITWNDLDMDRIYAQINACHSAAGEEYLYALLHMPAFAAEQEALSEEQLDYLRGHEQERTQLQMLFARLGTTGKYSLYDYLDYLDQLGKRSNARHYLALFLPIASVGVMFVSTQIGILCFVAALCYNMNTYFREKRKIDPYLVSFRYLMRLMNCAQQIGTALGRFRQGEQGTQPFGQESAELAALSAEFKSFRFGSGLLLYESVGSGNPLDIFLDYIRLLFHLDIIKFNSMLAEVWNKREKIDRMVTVVGRIETEICVASYREALPYYAIPELREWTAASADCSQPAMAAQTVPVPQTVVPSQTVPLPQTMPGGRNAALPAPFAAQELYHPLIAEPVPNSIEADKSVLLTGSNASGKSTFLKAAALCALLSQTIRTAPARSYTGAYYHIYSSMALRDNLQGGESYFIVEIKSLKRIVDAAALCSPVLCFVDEVLRGTNTVERIAASTQILQELASSGVKCFAATHDIELTSLLEGTFDNYHFEETIEDGDILFHYRLLSGKATTRNAIKLLSAIGYDQETIHRAEERAERFVRTGEWRL